MIMYNHTHIIYYEDLATPPTECPIVTQSSLRYGYNNAPKEYAIVLEWTGNAKTHKWLEFACTHRYWYTKR
jgi:hypothetical protein